MAIDEQDFHEFYQAWNNSVYSFCRLFLGADEPAELATQQAFVEYVRERDPLVTDKLPRKLMRNAVSEALKLEREEPRFPETEELEDLLPLLRPTDRAVFILRMTLDLSPIETASILQLPVETVNESWLKASLYLRDVWLKKK
ncbi:MAG TPA: sigma factor-like helix-turn-helix DNA-binding protein [Terriglobales bacterium]|nr:sigma factor-like helix-turn-helix DNA-binding protein [Terriglobales bacterium]